MLTTPFLSELDSRAAVKGSRDPLGVQSIWSRFGRRVVGNLTTVSSSVRDFTVMMLGYYFAERVAEEGCDQGELTTFLKWEQLAAYARARVHDEHGFRGTERVWRRLNEDERASLGVHANAQILGNQKTYGLWGLYTVPGRASGLIEGDPSRLTSAARELVERSYLPLLARGPHRDERSVIERLMRADGTLDLRPNSKDANLLDAVGAVLANFGQRERGFYREHLLYGGPNDMRPGDGTGGKQRVLAELLVETLVDPTWSVTPKSMATLASRARQRKGAGPELAEDLDRIRTCELVLAPGTAFFEHMLGCDGQAPKVIAAQVEKHWGSAPRATIDLGATEGIEWEPRGSDDGAIGARWMRLARMFHSGEYETAPAVTLDQNAAVMKARAAAAPWATVKEGKVHVSFRDEHLSNLPSGAELPEYWRHAYFIASLRDVAAAIEGHA